MNRTWQLQEAKSKFSELVNDAETGNIQIVTKRGKDCVAIISIEQYKDIFNKKGNLLDFLKRAPKVDLDIKRSKETGREINL